MFVYSTASQSVFIKNNYLSSTEKYMWLKSLEGKRKTGSLFIFVTHYINTINIQENKQKYIIMVEGKPKPETRGFKGPGS